MQYDDDTLAEAGARVRRVREAGRRLVDGPSPTDLAPLKERFFAALAEDFNTPAAMAVVFDWVREANKRADVGRDDLVEMLAVLGLDNLLVADAAGRPRRSRRWRSPRRGARDQGLRGVRPAARRDRSGRMGRPRRRRRL